MPGDRGYKQRIARHLGVLLWLSWFSLMVLEAILGDLGAIVAEGEWDNKSKHKFLYSDTNICPISVYLSMAYRAKVEIVVVAIGVVVLLW